MTPTRAPTSPAGRRYKDAIYEQFARVTKAVASPRRLELLELLAQSPRTVEALSQLAALSVANASQHLQVLKSAGLVEARKSGLYVTYRLAHPRVADLLLALHRVAEARVAEVERITRDFLASHDQLEPLDAPSLRRRVRSRQVTLVDVRPAEEYRAAHIPGAVSVPLPELARRLSDIPRRREVVAYCRGTYCVLAAEAVKLLRSRGFKAARLGEGVLEWAARGLPLDRAGQ